VLTVIGLMREGNEEVLFTLQMPGYWHFRYAVTLKCTEAAYEIPDAYRITLESVASQRTVLVSTADFCTAFTRDELKALYNRIFHIENNGQYLKEYQCLTHCCDSALWRQMEEDRVMKATLVKNVGHARNPVNHRLKGKFFFTSNMPKEDTSPFGNALRSFVPRLFFRKRESLCVFFADYYCYNSYDSSRVSSHRICIVICRKGSESFK
jgi:hypothetical protein